jgi:hypothetical protein
MRLSGTFVGFGGVVVSGLGVLLGGFVIAFLVVFCLCDGTLPRCHDARRPCGVRLLAFLLFSSVIFWGAGL